MKLKLDTIMSGGKVYVNAEAFIFVIDAATELYIDLKTAAHQRIDKVGIRAEVDKFRKYVADKEASK